MPQIHPTPDNCDHPSVRISRIVRAVSPNRKFRVIEGKCDACYSTVTRTQSQFELETGKTEAWYSVAK